MFEIHKLKHPIIQAPMAGGLSSPELVSSVINAGAVGSFGFAYSSAGKISQDITAASLYLIKVMKVFITKNQSIKFLRSFFFMESPCDRIFQKKEKQVHANKNIILLKPKRWNEKIKQPLALKGFGKFR